MRIEVVIAITALCACSADEPVGPMRAIDACSALTLVADNPTPAQLTGMDGAQALWRDRGAPALGRRAGATLEVRFEDAAQAFHGLYDDRNSIIYVNRAIERDGVLSIVIAHELGHAFGLVHVEDRVSVMNPGNLATPPTPADQESLAALWGACE